MLPLLQPRRWNFLQLDAASTKLAVSTTCRKSSWSLTLSMQQRKSLIVDRILIKSIQLPYSANCVPFSHLMNPTLLNFGNAPANSDGDKDSKSFSILPSYPTKLSWDYCKKKDCDDSLNLWKMTFQASDGKGRNFLDLLDDDFNPIEPHYAKGSPWLQAFSHSNTLCARAVRAITNHTPIGEYRLRFLPETDILCPCSNYSIEIRRHILHKC